MRLIHLTSSGGWGGREMYPAVLAAAQSRRGHDVSLVAKADTPLAGYLAGTSLDHDILRVSPYIDLVAAWRLSRILARRRPEIIQVHLSRDLALVAIGCSLAGQRPALILHKHIASSGSKKDIMHRYLYRKLSAVVAVSDFVRQSLIASCPIERKRIRVIFNGVDTEKFSHNLSCTGDSREALRRELGAEDNGSLIAGVVGRLEKRKGQDIFLKAAAIVAGRGETNLHFAVVGAAEGDYGRTLKEMAASLGLKGRVIFLGYRSDASRIYSALDILAVPSLEEAFGLVAAEGMLSGLPVVASGSGALPEFITHERTGLLFTPGDPVTLAGALVRLAQNPRLRSGLGLSAREWAMKNLCLEKILDDLDSLYTECLCSPPV